MVKTPPANAGDIKMKGQSLDQEDPLEETMATHLSILAWRIPWIEEHGRLQSIGWHTNAGDAGELGSIPGWGRSPGEGNGNPLQYSWRIP